LCPAISKDDISLTADHPPIAVVPMIQNNPDARKPTNMIDKTQFHHLRK
jgi:hypothetical protein